MVLNYNQAEATLRALEELRRSRGVRVDAIAVDAASEPADLAVLRAKVDPDRLVALPDNRGYAGGMNAGTRFWMERDPDTPILLVTPDARIGDEVVATLLDALEGDPAAGAVGPVVVYSGDPLRIGAGGRIHPRTARVRLLRRVRADEPYRADWVEGCCILLRPAALRDVGGLDEPYFLYFEEIDLCTRLGAAGWRVLVAPSASVLHPKEAGGQSPHYFYYMARNAHRFWRRNFGIGPLRPTLESAWSTIWLALVMAGLLLRPRRWREIPARLRDLRLQLAGTWAGTLDALRGRYGRRRAPGRRPGGSRGSAPPSD